MNRISEQSLPLWQRSTNPRGHKSSIEKALQAHRSQVNDRNERTLTSQRSSEIKDQFFPRTYPGRDQLATTASSTTEESPIGAPASPKQGGSPVTAPLTESSSHKLGIEFNDNSIDGANNSSQANSTTGSPSSLSDSPRAMAEIYEELSVDPVRNLAPTLVANESIDELTEVRSDDRPSGPTLDLMA